VIIFSDVDKNNQGELLHKFATEYLKPDVVLVMKILATNVNGLVVSELVKYLWQSYVSKSEKLAASGSDPNVNINLQSDNDDDDDQPPAAAFPISSTTVSTDDDNSAKGVDSSALIGNTVKDRGSVTSRNNAPAAANQKVNSNVGRSPSRNKVTV
jgi:hypothetical protein